jgi:hypothetical protein
VVVAKLDAGDIPETKTPAPDMSGLKGVSHAHH